MKMSSWFMLIGVLVGIGCLKVTEHNAIYFKGYALGEQVRSLHETDTQVGWLNVEVEGLASPGRLAQVAQERRLKLVAWSTFGAPAGQLRSRLTPARASQTGKGLGSGKTPGLLPGMVQPLPTRIGGPLPLMHVAVAPDDEASGAGE